MYSPVQEAVRQEDLEVKRWLQPRFQHLSSAGSTRLERGAIANRWRPCFGRETDVDSSLLPSGELGGAAIDANVGGGNPAGLI